MVVSASLRRSRSAAAMAAALGDGVDDGQTRVIIYYYSSVRQVVEDGQTINRAQ